MSNLQFVNNTLATFVYEPFSYTISNPGSYTLTTSNVTSGIPPGYIVNTGFEVVFSTPSNGMAVGTEIFTVTATDVSGTIVAVSSNTVNNGSGRFLDTLGNSYLGSNFAFFKNEPITPIPLVAPFAISVPTSVPTLPPGLTYVSNASNIYSITGTPLVTVPQSNYLVIGKATGSNLGKIVTSQFGMSVSNERVQLNLAGSPIVSPMTVGTPISQLVVTAQYPPYPSGGILRYTWSGLPDGITVADSLGNSQTSPFFPLDSSSTLKIQGTPTIDAANAYRNAGITSNVVTFTATRTSPLPQISNALPITFGFGETVLFDSVTVPTLYSGVTLDPSATFFRAQTYFGSGSAIATIFSPDLRSDLSLNFVAGTGRAYLTGGPGATGTNTYTIRAINSNTVSRDLAVPITVATDTVSFLSPTPNPIDACYNFVLSRPISASLTGYYTSNIQFRAVAASGNAVNFSTASFAGTGLSLSNVSADTVELVGIPESVTPLTTATITASAVGTPATATTTVKFAILNDLITITPPQQLSFIQNRAITPIQLIATTLSERPVISFTSPNLPNGLVISPTGLITGTPTNDGVSTVTLTASTGYASSSISVTMSVIEDNMVIVMLSSPETVNPTFSGVEFRALTYSGEEGILTTSLSNQAPYQGSNFTTSFASGTSLQGDFSSVPVLLPEYRFLVTGTAGSYSNTAEVHAITNNAPIIARTRIELVDLTNIVPSVLPFTSPPTPPLGTVRIMRSTETPAPFAAPLGLTVTPNTLTWSSVYDTSGIPYGIHDMAQNGSVLVATIGNSMLRSADAGATWSLVPSSNIQSIDVSGGPPLIAPPAAPTYYPPKPLFGCIATDGTSNWLALASGAGVNGVGPPNTILRTSSDNGVTWSDISTSTVLPITRNTKLFYSNGRYIVLAGESNATNPLLYADASTVSTWTAPIGLTGSILRDLASSNGTIVVVGDDMNGSTIASTCFVSSNAGTVWSPLSPQPFVGTYSDLAVNTITYAYGQWVVGGRESTRIAVSASSNLISWTTASGNVGTATCSVEDGGAWQVGGGSSWLTGLWDANGAIGWTGTTGPVVQFGSKRMTSTSVSSGVPTLTMSIVNDPSGIAFVSPTQTSYTNWQFVPISTIPILATNPVPGSFLYYYATGLPRGLTLNLDASGIEASITGTSTQYSDASQRVVLYATLSPGGGGGGVSALPLSMRTILPTVQKQQTSAGAWTSLLRQYTVVNAAQNSVNGKTLPSTEPPLGEFTRPQPPDSVSATGDPNCVKRC
jgi:hypothetical protein